MNCVSPELLLADLARVELGHVVDGVDVPGHVRRAGKRLVTDVAFVLSVLKMVKLNYI
jgi:hypothetical protein